jgi:hypothetical protein
MWFNMKAGELAVSQKSCRRNIAITPAIPNSYTLFKHPGRYTPNLRRYALGEAPVCRWKSMRKYATS